MELLNICPKCQGTGGDGNPDTSVPCAFCGGEGTISMNIVVPELDTRLAEIEERVGANISIDCWGYSTITQGTFTREIHSDWYQDRYLESVDPLDGDQVNYRVFMVAGTYTVSVIHAKTFRMGILKVLIDNVEATSIDCYVDADHTVFIERSSTYDVVVPTTGFKVVSFKVDGKNLLSSDYFINVSALFFDKTA